MRQVIPTERGHRYRVDVDGELKSYGEESLERFEGDPRSPEFWLTQEPVGATDCVALMPIAHLRTVPKTNRTNEEFGTLMVGRDIHPGTWRGTAIGSCYWARLSGFSGEFGDIITNNNVDEGAKFTITIKSTDKGLEIDSDCGTMTRA